MSNWIPKSKIIKVSVTVALLSIALYFVALFLVFREAKMLENFYQNTRLESSKEERFLVIKSIVETNSGPIQALEDFFVKKDDEVKFIEQIEAIAGTSGIKFEIVSIDVGANQESSLKEDVNIKVGVEGGWREIMLFVNKLEKMPFGVLVENVNLDAKDPGNWAGLIDFVVFREK